MTLPTRVSWNHLLLSLVLHCCLLIGSACITLIIPWSFYNSDDGVRIWIGLLFLSKGEDSEFLLAINFNECMEKVFEKDFFCNNLRLIQFSSLAAFLTLFIFWCLILITCYKIIRFLLLSQNHSRSWIEKFSWIFNVIGVSEWFIFGFHFKDFVNLWLAPYLNITLVVISSLLLKYHLKIYKSRFDKNRNVN